MNKLKDSFLNNSCASNKQLTSCRKFIVLCAVYKMFTEFCVHPICHR